MAAVFVKVAPLIIAAEGDEESDSPSDYGGQSKYGISKREYPDLDIANLTEEKALAILEEDYWQKYHVGQIENQGIANQVFFLLINMNPLQAIRIVQIAINACGRGIINTTIDGILGSQTLQALNSIADGWLSNRIRLEAISYYLHVTDVDKTQIANFRGWVRRALIQ